jgi:phosphatidylserine decarboxylase
MSRVFIPTYVRHYRVNTSEAEQEVADYTNLRDFFVRRLKPDRRPIAPGAGTVVSPVDGRVAVFGVIEQGMLIQAKGIYYSVEELLGGDTERAKEYEGGTFLTIYLSPSDYHRIHMPLAGQVAGYTYVPGTLFPVNPFGVRAVKGLFARNERLISYLATDMGEIALIKVGATIVGSVQVVYEQSCTNPKLRKHKKPEFKQLNAGPYLAKGEELALFEFGSTVILLFPKGRINLNPDLAPQKVVRMGEAIGEIIS